MTKFKQHKAREAGSPSRTLWSFGFRKETLPVSGGGFCYNCTDTDRGGTETKVHTWYANNVFPVLADSRKTGN